MTAAASRFSATDLKFMTLALQLSERGMGFTEPNPQVGAVVVKQGRIVSWGFHRAFGGEHAEQVGLRDLRQTGCTLYVTLEPCAHFGKTPPCVDRIIEKKVARVVVALRDPNPLVSGRGIKTLRRHGIRVDVGCLEDWAAHINRHYLKAIRRELPYVTLRAGMSLDGKLADRHGTSRWITSPTLRRISHSLRGEFSAIMVGRNTVVSDNPRLTVRHADWIGKRLCRVVLDSQNRLSPEMHIFKEQERFPLILFSSRNAVDRTPKSRQHHFVSHDADGLSLPEVLRILYRLGVTSVLVEGGGRLIDSFLRQRLHDELVCFVSSKLVGGREAVQLFRSGIGHLDQAQVLDEMELIPLESEYVIRGKRRCSPE